MFDEYLEQALQQKYNEYLAILSQAIQKMDNSTVRARRIGFLDKRAVISWLLIQMETKELNDAFVKSMKTCRGIPTLNYVMETAINDHHGIDENDKRCRDWVEQLVRALMECSDSRAIVAAKNKIDNWYQKAALLRVGENHFELDSKGELRHLLDPGLDTIDIISDGNGNKDTVRVGGYSECHEKSCIPMLVICEQYRDELRQSALKGFEAFCREKLMEAQTGECDHIMRFYLLFCRLLDDEETSKAALEAIDAASQASADAENAIWHFYATNAEHFKQAFEWHPDLAFEVDGRRKFRHLTLFYEGKGHFRVDASPDNGGALIIPAGHNDEPARRRRGKGGVPQYPKFDQGDYSAWFDEAFSRVQSIVAEKAERHYILGIKEEVDSRLATLIDKHVVLAFRYRELWWFLVESPYQGEQVRLCWGATERECREAIAKTPGEFRQSHNTRGANHGIRRGEDLYGTMVRLLKTTDCRFMFQ